MRLRSFAPGEERLLLRMTPRGGTTAESIPTVSDEPERLKALINSSMPIVVMETAEEMRAVRVVRVACSTLTWLRLSGALPAD